MMQYAADSLSISTTVCKRHNLVNDGLDASSAFTCATCKREWVHDVLTLAADIVRTYHGLMMHAISKKLVGDLITRFYFPRFEMIWFVVIGSSSRAGLTCIVLHPTSTETLDIWNMYTDSLLIEASLSVLQYLLSTSQIMQSFQTRTSKFNHTNPYHIPQTEIQSTQLHATSSNKIVTWARHFAWAAGSLVMCPAAPCQLQCVSSSRQCLMRSAAVCQLGCDVSSGAICQLSCHLLTDLSA